MLTKHFVEFFFPGVMTAESTTKPIESWDVDRAVEMTRQIEKQHGDAPYGFRFATRQRRATDLNSRVTKTSPMHYLGGEVLTLADIEARNDPKDRVLIDNMRCNGWDRVIVNRNSWRWTSPLKADDVVVPFEPKAKGG